MWWLLIVALGALKRDALDHVRVERALRQKLRLRAQPLGHGLGRPLEHLDERPADELPLPLRVLDVFQRVHERVGRVDDDEVDVEVLAEGGLDLLTLVFAQQPVVDEHAGQLIANRFVQQHRRDGRIDAAREAEDDVVAADRLADLGFLLFDERRRRPVAAAPADPEHEVLHELAPVLGVDDLGVELHAVDRAVFGGYGGDRRVLRMRDRVKTVGQRGEVVAVAHPDRRTVGDVGEESSLVVHDEMRAAELTAFGALDAAAEFVGNRLKAVADPEHRHRLAVVLQTEHGRVEPGRAVVVDRARAAGEDDALRAEGGDLGSR